MPAVSPVACNPLAMADLPSGTVTFLFTDIEGSTRLLHELGEEAYADALDKHRLVVREACRSHGGVEVDTQGDAFFVAFPTAPAALQAAAATRDALQTGPIRLRTGIHTGTPLLTAEGYVGHDVHRAARIAAAGHGGQVLVSASTAALVGTNGLRDLGEHRLKDLSAPERIYQLGDAEFPPLNSLYQTNLPIAATPFLGRERELAEVSDLLGHEDVRLLTLTGPGGTGKTRLAAQVAGERAAHYPDGVWWVPLAALRDPELVLPTAAQVVGAKEDLADHLADKSMLLLFDNFEHLIGAAGEVGSLRTSCPNLDVLVTSREPLHVGGEQEYEVQPFLHEEGVGFFIARARTVEPGFQADDAVSEICKRLDDLPLALELAAARVKALSSAQILGRLAQRLPLLTGGARDAPERQRTLRATIDWSYQLLTSDEQHLFAGLAVLRGGCTLEAAEQICEADLDTLQSLVDKSLLRHTGERYWMLETIREYASEQLEGSGEAEEFERRHAEHFLALAEAAEPNLHGNPGEWLNRLDHEHDNLRAALDQLEAAGEGERVLRLAGALSRFWYIRGHVAEGRRRLEGALRAYDAPTAGRAKALNGAAVMALESGDAATGRLRAEEGLALHCTLVDAWGAAHSGFLLGHAVADEGDSAVAQQLFGESLRRFRELGDEHHTLLATYNLAMVIEDLGDPERARALHEENLHRARTQSNERIVALSLDQLASYARDEGRVEDALSMLQESLRIRRDLGDRPAIAENLSRFARTLAMVGRAGTAARLLSGSEALREQIGSASVPWVTRMNEETLTTIRTQLDDAAFAQAWQQGQALSADEAITLALDS
jgi:predicted ATPase/class 3 adenylate cyclase